MLSNLDHIKKLDLIMLLCIKKRIKLINPFVVSYVTMCVLPLVTKNGKQNFWPYEPKNIST